MFYELMCSECSKVPSRRFVYELIGRLENVRVTNVTDAQYYSLSVGYSLAYGECMKNCGTGS